MEIIFISLNKNKFREVREILKKYQIKVKRKPMKLREIQSIDVRKVIKEKIIYASEKIKEPFPFFVEDTSLEIESLNKFPGAFISYIQKTIGNKGILKLMENIENRNARAICCLGLKLFNKIKIFEGVLNGKISYEEKGNGWGFDPIFMPENSNKTLAELGKIKNEISHRKMALEKMAKYLLKYGKDALS